ncbi:CLUMA_CG015034, isoform A [Clunio marinus]|uniref:CLUMA_CG015034, isoform A n=1 Tax=Clunio marinus TaxID=568069 RepID=A0A1J1INL4_9DIPT|nr:CLUMA_CG015034, isoform A [Clunio marinus]
MKDRSCFNRETSNELSFLSIKEFTRNKPLKEKIAWGKLIIRILRQRSSYVEIFTCLLHE